jgi:hypothetical protein
MHSAYSIKSPRTYAAPCKWPPKWVNIHYVSTFIDVYSHHVSVYLQKTKDETLSKLQIYIPRVETVTSQHVNYFHSDSGGEYDSDIFRTYLRERGIYHDITNTYTLQENGVSEWMNRTIIEMACCKGTSVHFLTSPILPYSPLVHMYFPHTSSPSPGTTLKGQ